MSQRELTLVVAEVAHVQSYIFGSNRLKENVGASYLVASATEDWAYETLLSQNMRINVEEYEKAKYRLVSDRYIENNNLDAEVLYSGGGNFVGLFVSKDIARQFISALSERVLLRAPNLHFVCHHETFDWEDIKYTLSTSVGNAIKKLKEQRSHQPVQQGLGGLSVTAMCASTQLPAVWMHQQPRDNNAEVWEAVSAEVIAKRQSAIDANNRLKEALLTRTDYDFPLELDSLGRTKGDISQMAVVHADGNGMGRIIVDVFSKIIDNRTYIDLMREFSQRIKDLARFSQVSMLDHVLNSIEVEYDDKNREIVFIRHSKELKERKIFLDANVRDGGYYLPIRPLISGGDDVTFTCDARLAFALSQHLIEAFERESEAVMAWLRHEVKPLKEFQELSPEKQNEVAPLRLTACAGIAIVNVHYPFARAYELAEELCQSGKQERRKRNLQSGTLDWHHAMGGLYGSLEEMREREVMVTAGRSLTLRPVFHGINADEYNDTFRSWQFVERITKEFQAEWGNHRGKAHDLLTNLREGSAATRMYKQQSLSPSSKQWKRGLPPYLPEHEVHRFHKSGGWRKEYKDGDMRYCGYYDALELMDLYFPLHSSNEEEATNV